MTTGGTSQGVPTWPGGGLHALGKAVNVTTGHVRGAIYAQSIPPSGTAPSLGVHGRRVSAACITPDAAPHRRP